MYCKKSRVVEGFEVEKRITVVGNNGINNITSMCKERMLEYGMCHN